MNKHLSLVYEGPKKLAVNQTNLYISSLIQSEQESIISDYKSRPMTKMPYVDKHLRINVQQKDQRESLEHMTPFFNAMKQDTELSIIRRPSSANIGKNKNN